MTDLKRLRELREKANPGPLSAHFELVVYVDADGWFCDCGEDTPETHANAELICEAVNALPTLLDDIETLRADNKELITRLAAKGETWEGSYRQLAAAIYGIDETELHENMQHADVLQKARELRSHKNATD